MNLTPVYRITTFVPPTEIERVKESISAVSEISYGNYQGVFWTSSAGIEQFTPLENANPTEGIAGAISKTPSLQLLFSIPKDQSLLEKVITAIRRSHPWEEPVIYIDEVFASLKP